MFRAKNSYVRIEMIVVSEISEGPRYFDKGLVAVTKEQAFTKSNNFLSRHDPFQGPWALAIFCI